MVREELVDMEKAEAAAKEEVKKRVKGKGEVTGIVDIESTIESTEFTVVGNIPVYEIKCSASVTFEGRSGAFLNEPKRKKDFEVQVHAESGKVIGFSFREGE